MLLGSFIEILLAAHTRNIRIGKKNIIGNRAY